MFILYSLDFISKYNSITYRGNYFKYYFAGKLIQM